MAMVSVPSHLAAQVVVEISVLRGVENTQYIEFVQSASTQPDSGLGKG